MPNYSYNSVQIAGPKATLERIAVALQGTSGAFDFTKISPIPEELKEVMNRGFNSDLPDPKANYKKTVINETLHQNTKLRVGSLLYSPLTTEEVLELSNTYGATNSHGWVIKNWGTKWNAVDIKALGIDDRNGYSVLKYQFMTAWAPPLPVLEKIVDQFPGVEVFLNSEVEDEIEPVIWTFPEVTKYPVDTKSSLKKNKVKDIKRTGPQISDEEWYGTYLEHAMRSTANRSFQVGFQLPKHLGGTSLACLLETWSLIGPKYCVEIEPGIPLFLQKWERVPSFPQLGKELSRVCGDPHLFGYVSKSLGSRQVSTFMLNRAAWGYLVEAAEKTLRGEKTYVPFEVARFLTTLESHLDLRFGDGVKFSVTNGRLTGGELILARGWRDALST